MLMPRPWPKYLLQRFASSRLSSTKEIVDTARFIERILDVRRECAVNRATVCREFVGVVIAAFKLPNEPVRFAARNGEGGWRPLAQRATPSGLAHVLYA